MAYRKRYNRAPPRKPRGVVVAPVAKRDALAERKAFVEKAKMEGKKK